MAFHLHRAERTDRLAQGLGELLATPPADPFAMDLVLVPARGVERWLSQRLSHVLGAAQAGGNDGACAAVRFRSPRSLLAELTGAAEEDPWDPDALTWPLLDVLDQTLAADAAQPWCAALAAHLGVTSQGEEAELRRGRRYAVARRLAGLFASYGRQRPALLTDWAAGRDTDGAGADLDTDLSWQPILWRRLLDRVPADPPDVRHRNTVQRLRNGKLTLPQRLSLFGHTRLSVTDLELLGAIGTHHDLHLWLPHPSDALWQRLSEHRDDGTGPLRRRADDSHRFVGHPLLATLGRDVRELQRGLVAEPHGDEYRGPAVRPESLLGWLQQDLAADAVRPAGRTRGPEDRSVQVHSCHGPARQVEVLREVLLGLLADDPTLEPRDILVMCPDIERYAPLIVAGFGLGDLAGRPVGASPTGHPAHRLRVQLADRSLDQTNPLLGVADQLLSMAGGRGTATELLDLAQAAPVRSRFGFTDDDLETLIDWVRSSGIRWGIDAEHRRPYGLDGIVHNTWRFGLDRILSGVAMSADADAWIGTTLPLDDVGSNRVELAGRFAEFCDRLAEVLDGLSGTRPLSVWLENLHRGIDTLTRAHGEESWQRGQLDRELAQVAAAAEGNDGVTLRLNDVRALLRDHLVGRPTRANFRTGAITVCTMTPMRSVPHRVVCLVGLDDGVFPRSSAVDGDDVLLRDPLVGERDRRAEDRQLLLDAIGAAGETLIITYTGTDEVTGRSHPPAVPLAELLDALDRTTGVAVRSEILVDHPLLPFDARNVIPGALKVPGKPFSFDPAALAGARAAVTENRPQPPQFLTGPLPAVAVCDVELDDLLTFFRDPIRGFFRELEFGLPWQQDEYSDAIPVEIDSLTEWTVGDRMLRDLMNGMEPKAVLQAEWRRGTLPPGRLGWRRAGEILAQAVALDAGARPYRRPDPGSVDVDIPLPGGRRLTGTVAPLHGTTLVSTSYSRPGGKQLLQAWIPLLAISAHRPGTRFSARCISRRRGPQPVAETLLASPPDPVALLADLVAVYDAGRMEPLPLPMKASYAWAQARRDRDDPKLRAGWAWKTGKYPGECEELPARRAWGEHGWDVLIAAPRPDEQVAGENTRLGCYAARVWGPLLDAEEAV